MKITVSPTDRPYETFEIEVEKREDSFEASKTWQQLKDAESSPFSLDYKKLFNLE